MAQGQISAQEGSSPLTRGKRGGRSPRRRRGGLIPAHAGKTSSFSWLLRRSAAHPRSREENFLGLIAILIIVGSSPLKRGELAENRDGDMRVGLIPAHAGKTYGGRSVGYRSGAHPRSRGENLDGYRETYEEWGSSPLTRGKHLGSAVMTL